MHTDTRHNQAFTLLELLVSVAVFGLVIVFLLQSFTTNQRTYMVVDQVSEVQRNIRVVADLMQLDIRSAGYMVPDHAAVCGWDNTNAPDVLFVSNPDAIRTADALAAIDPAMPGQDLGAPVTLGAGVTLGNTVSITQDFVDVATDGDDFVEGAGVIVVDRADVSAGAACGIIQVANSGSLQVAFGPTSLTASASPDVVAVPAHVYRVAGGAQLERNGLVLAPDVEDLQLAYFFDANGDRNVDPGETVGDGVGADYDPSAVDGSTLREVRFSLVMRTRSPDPNEDWNLGAGQATENRAPGSVAGPDSFHRRLYQGRASIRNLGSI